MIKQQDLIEFINELLDVKEQSGDPAGVYHKSDKEIYRLGLMLEPTADISEWVIANSLDALFLHRPWKLNLHDISADCGVIAYHRAFDNLLGVGFNPFLATDLAMRDVKIFAYKDGVPLGMLGDIESQHWQDFRGCVAEQFEGVEATVAPPNDLVKRIVVVGAMNDDLVRKAAEANADVYLTGQLRVPARRAVAEIGIGVIATGHARGEMWGLRKLAVCLEQKFPDLQTFVYS